MDIVCDECGSTRVEEYLKNPPEEPEPQTMSEYIENSGRLTTTPAVVNYYEMVLHCKDCGCKREFTVIS